MLEDEESNQRQQLMRHMFLRAMVPGFTRADLLQSFFRERNDSSMLYRMAFDLIDKENPIGNDRRRFRRESKRAREYDVEEMFSQFRFTHDQFYTLLACLRVPNEIKFKTYSFDGEEALLLLLRRMGSVTTFRSLRMEFRREEPELCACFNGMITWLCEHHGWLISGINLIVLNTVIIYLYIHFK